jgi:hypothetical protein
MQLVLGHGVHTGGWCVDSIASVAGSIAQQSRQVGCVCVFAPVQQEGGCQQGCLLLFGAAAAW